MWSYILSEEGIRVWLGEIDIDDFEIQKQLVTKEGIEVKLTVLKLDCHLRFKWRPSHFDRPSTVELRVTSSSGRAKVIFHHTGFYILAQVEELRSYWKGVISKMMVDLAAYHG
jgi:hypothetical protein